MLCGSVFRAEVFGTPCLISLTSCSWPISSQALPPDDFVPLWTRESPAETAALAELWDQLGLLARAFNCYKAADKGRRGQNFAESRLSGPSLFIPVGPTLGMLEADPARQVVLGNRSQRLLSSASSFEQRSLCQCFGPCLAALQGSASKRFLQSSEASGCLVPFF